MTADLESHPADPLRLFADTLEAARRVCQNDPTAMVLSTVDARGRPASRYVLLKDVDSRGFAFYTNLSSRKAAELAQHPGAALCFLWPPLGKQIRIEGTVEPVSDAEADAYFASRPRSHQLGAWASRQSATLASREELEERYRKYERRFEGGPVPRPDFWSGYRVVPDQIEFWTMRPDRLHDRIVYRLTGAQWTHERIYP
ncbi:MAG TPA: pyridoxamine 5'-phosphate oxidase [Vicinamibacterales bacterium]|nr:pyridoxamine 5'-phosphate oxidase [Vicinamibacterales bacterium]